MSTHARPARPAWRPVLAVAGLALLALSGVLWMASRAAGGQDRATAAVSSPSPARSVMTLEDTCRELVPELARARRIADEAARDPALSGAHDLDVSGAIEVMNRMLAYSPAAMTDDVNRILSMLHSVRDATTGGGLPVNWSAYRAADARLSTRCGV